MADEDPARTGLRLVRRLPAPPEEVFNAWTTRESVMQWMCPRSTSVGAADLDVRVGGQFRIVMKDEAGEYAHTGEYREIDAPRRLVFTWESQATRGKTTLVTVELHPRGKHETKLILTHERFPDETSASKHEYGWGDILTKLMEHLKID